MLFKGCVGEGLFRRVNAATKRVLAANDYNVESPSSQVCCGALHAHAGELEGARSLARQNIMAFASEPDAPVVTNAGGCGAMLLSYGHLLSDDPDMRDRANAFSRRIRDVGQLLTVDQRPEEDNAEPLVTYDSSCHLLYGQHAADDSLRMMRSAGNLRFVPLFGAERCCGGAGIYNLLEADLSGAILREKIQNIRNTGAEIVATGNPGCQMQIGAGLKLAGLNVRVCHPVELVDEWYEQSGRYSRGGNK
jgi:glycolate oxidase iron-sulfur subunit